METSSVKETRGMIFRCDCEKNRLGTSRSDVIIQGRRAGRGGALDVAFAKTLGRYIHFYY